MTTTKTPRSHGQSIAHMAALARMTKRHGGAKRLAPRYWNALAIYERNITARPEVARLTYADAIAAGI